MNIYFLYRLKTEVMASIERFYGDGPCSAMVKSKSKPCTNKAYFYSNGGYFCSIHSKDDETRIKLASDPNLKEKLINKTKDRALKIEEAKDLNISNSTRGQVICTKMKIMKEIEKKDGYLLVFPNFKHGNRKDGLGLPSLSPMSMGPINHGQPGLPQSENLENFHQGNKVYSDEVGLEGDILPIFYERQKALYESKIPQRHKIKTDGSLYRGITPLFSLFRTKKAEGDLYDEHRITYVESRQFYCNFYERFALEDKEFLELKHKVSSGYNIQICGYDAYSIDYTDSDKSLVLEKCYLDASKPFGHEMVLLSLLILEPKDYPWRKHKTFEF